MKFDLIPVRQNAKKLRKTLRKFASQPSPKAVHKLRTRIRRFETGVPKLLGPDNTPKPNLFKTLRRIRKKAGKVRDLDVFTSDLASLHSVGEDERLVELILYIGARRHKAAAKLSSAAQKHANAIRNDIKSALRRFEKQAGKVTRPDRETAERINRERVISFLDAARAASVDRKNLHAYRLKIKELRDELLLTRPAHDPRFIDELGEVKDAIGEWHDWEELLATGKEVLQHRRSCKLLEALKKRSDEKYREALRKTNRLRRRYLKQSKTGVVVSQAPSR